jgi:GMP reductase
MKCTIDQKLARWMSETGYFYIMHRFGLDESSKTPEACWEDNFKFIQQANLGTSPFDDRMNRQMWHNISVSIGVQEGDKELLKRVVDAGYVIDYLTVDIAHAHSIRMEKMAEFINGLKLRGRFPDTRPFLIAGNVASPQAVVDVESWNVDCTKVGIAQGGACTTYGQTGFGVPMFSCMLACNEAAKKPIIADGGIKTNGDFAKAIRAGGDMVMAGGLFACSTDSPAESFVKLMRTGEVKTKSDIGGGVVTSTYEDRIVAKHYKRYYGSASSFNKHSDKHVEGRMVELECDGVDYLTKLHHIEEALQSATSYAGDDLRGVDWGIVY